MSTKEFKLPDLGEGLQEVEIISWHVTEGDFVVNEQPLLSVETEKAVVDIPSPQSGKIVKLHAAAGDTMKIGSVLVEFANDNGEPSEDSGSVVGNLEAGVEDTPSASDFASPSAAFSPPPPAPASSAAISSPPAAGAAIKAIPAARKLAQDLGLDLGTIRGSGPNGTITVPDVREHSQSPPSQKTSMDNAPPSLPEGYEPLSGVRKSMATLMAKSHREVVPATLHDEADIQVWYGNANIMVRLIQGVVHACRAEPIVNSWFAHNALKHNDSVNLGIAVDTPDGLLVPVLKGVDTLSAEQIKTELNRIKEAAKNRSLQPSEFKDATLTLSNFGALAGQHGAMVIAPPQVAIVGCGRLLDKVVLENGTAVTHKTLPLSLTLDHRALTGGEAARFMAALIESLSKGSGA